jgi:hypothetical protein
MTPSRTLIQQTLLLTMIITLVMGCSGEDETPAPVYSDISGTWEFSSESYSGEIKISKTIDGYFVNERGATFTINGVSYTSWVSSVVWMEGSSGEMATQAEDARLVFRDLRYDRKFSQMVSTYQSIWGRNYENASWTQETVFFKRK